MIDNYTTLYPQPTNVEIFEKLYLEEHVPLAIEGMEGKTKIVATKILASARVRDGNLVTGQQQYSGAQAARLVIEALGV